ncbi:gp004.1L [Rabbit fibroma virus]|uniref:Gp004.1L n=1 Tax=Rabbit fibroma virus (strain Kasza) TaxID=10272 RepID=Q9PX79_RFVKA|nr:gp004.1L [Rabbit fibroma virus]NP_052045.1 gp004.1R [Rabbit fibroma virus]AAF18038.1 gp004.1R [Rabbit fibroma virus]AAF18039.1 gp004.1L [Rabbit fibroma virus]
MLSYLIGPILSICYFVIGRLSGLIQYLIVKMIWFVVGSPYSYLPSLNPFKKEKKDDGFISSFNPFKKEEPKKGSWFGWMG